MKPKRHTDPKLLEKVRKRPCIVCRWPPPSDPSHIRSRGAGGHDLEHNVVPMCRGCHQRWHNRGWIRFCQEHPEFADTLDYMGWDLDYEHKKLTHPKARKP